MSTDSGAVLPHDRRGCARRTRPIAPGPSGDEQHCTVRSAPEATAVRDAGHATASKHPRRQPMKLYINPMSPNVRRVRLTAAVLGMDLEEKKLDFTKGEHKNPEYLALNPNGAVPTLVDGDFVLTESRAIMQYLASKKPESGLLPRDEKARADVMRWQFWDASHFSPQLGTLAFEKIVKAMMGMGEPDQRRIDDALTNFRRFGAVL